MKRTVYSIAIGAMALILTAATAAGQGTQPTAEQQKQKEFEMQKQKEADMQKKLKTLSGGAAETEAVRNGCKKDGV